MGNMPSALQSFEDARDTAIRDNVSSHNGASDNVHDKNGINSIKIVLGEVLTPAVDRPLNGAIDNDHAADAGDDKDDYENRDKNSTNIPKHDGQKCDFCPEAPGLLSMEKRVYIGCREKHVCCEICIEGLIRSALVSRLSFPPTCCGMEVTLEVAQAYLPSDLIDEYKEKEPEFKSKNPSYCGECFEYLPLQQIVDDIATCVSCGIKTCTGKLMCSDSECGKFISPEQRSKGNCTCGSASKNFVKKPCGKPEHLHGWVSFDERHCPEVKENIVDSQSDSTRDQAVNLSEAEDLALLEGLFASMGCMRCPECTTIVSKSEGCDHMTCTVCKTDFHIKCGRVYDETGRCGCFEHLSGFDDVAENDRQMRDILEWGPAADARRSAREARRLANQARAEARARAQARTRARRERGSGTTTAGNRYQRDQGGRGNGRTNQPRNNNIDNDEGRGGFRNGAGGGRGTRGNRGAVEIQDEPDRAEAFVVVGGRGAVNQFGNVDTFQRSYGENHRR